MTAKKGAYHPVDCDCEFCLIIAEDSPIGRPIEHTCDGTNKNGCACSVARRAQIKAWKRGALPRPKRRHQPQSPEAAARSRLKNYGLTVEQYEALYVAQNGCCALCGRPEAEVRTKIHGLVVDHCHSENRVRALLCHRCNVGIGYFHNNPEQLRAAAAYLERTQSSTYVPGLELAFPTGAGQALGEAVSSRDGTG